MLLLLVFSFQREKTGLSQAFGSGSGGHMGVPCRVFLLPGFRTATSEVRLVGAQATRTRLVGRGAGGGQGDSASAAAGRREPGDLHLR